MSEKSWHPGTVKLDTMDLHHLRHMLLEDLAQINRLVEGHPGEYPANEEMGQRDRRMLRAIDEAIRTATWEEV